jgi:Cadherin domain
VTPENDNLPAFTSQDTASVAENSTAVLTLTATDADLPAQSISFAITGGADQASFTINEAGELVFATAPDFELPADFDGDNVYEVVIEASDGAGGTATQSLRLTVTDVDEEILELATAGSAGQAALAADLALADWSTPAPIAQATGRAARMVERSWQPLSLAVAVDHALLIASARSRAGIPRRQVDVDSPGWAIPPVADDEDPIAPIRCGLLPGAKLSRKPAVTAAT